MTTTPPQRSDPSHPLPIATRTMWLCEAVSLGAVVAGGALIAAASADGLLRAATVLVALVAIAWGIAFALVRFSRWRWELHDEELDLRHGAWSVVRTIVPITRIQHVSVERTGWTDLFGLVRLHAHTAAGKTTIPGLERSAADDLRDGILARLRTPDDL